MKVYEAIAEVVRREGTRAVFGLMGDGNLKLVPYLTEDLDIPFYGSRHEGGAVAMADAHARMSGEVGVSTFTQGPGLTNALTALVTARRAGTPMVVLSGDTPRAVAGHPQDIKQEPLFAAAEIPVQELGADDAAVAVAAAFARARAERRPIALNLPTDLQEMETSAPGAQALPTAGVEAAVPDPVELDAAVVALEAAQRPIVLAGRGAWFAGAEAAVGELADRTGALIAHSLPLKGWLAGHSWNLGIAGGFATETAKELIGDADGVLVLGAGLNHFTSRGGTLFDPGATIIHCDVEPAAFGRFLTPSLTIRGDAAAVAAALSERLAVRQGYRTDAVAAKLGAARERPTPDEGEPGAIDPRALSARIDAMIPADRNLIVDGGHFAGFPSMAIGVPEPGSYVFPLDFGSIGLSLGAAVGAAVARPDRITAVGIGDGGLMMSLGELDTAIRYSLPLLVVVYDDGAFGAEMHFLRMLGIPDAESLFETPPLAEVARGMGADAFTIHTLADLDPIAERLATGLERPLLLHCTVGRNIRAPWLEDGFDRGDQ
jgi:thiamine pyrophosphate-dependent acetolactate synthase large subunit-like protein